MGPLLRGPTCRPYGFKITKNGSEPGTPLKRSDLLPIFFDFLEITNFNEICNKFGGRRVCPTHLKIR